MGNIQAAGVGLTLAIAGAFKFGELRFNPIEGMKFLTVPKSIRRDIKHPEFEKLYHAASDHFKPIPICAYRTGMRRSEIAKLMWKDIDLVDRYIHVEETKNDEAKTIPICDTLLDALQKLKENSKSEFVFTTHEGNPYLHKSAWKRTWSTA